MSWDEVWIGKWIYWTLALVTTNNYENLTELYNVKDYCNYSTHKVFSVFTSCCLVAASNGWRSPSSGFSNFSRSQLPLSHISQLQLSADSINNSKSKSKFILRLTVSRSVCLGVKSHLGQRPDFCYCQTVAGFLMLRALSDEMASLSFTVAAGPRQCSHSRVRVQWDSRQYFTVSESRLPKPGEPGPSIYIP
jgi:hypothetical protein